MARQRDNEVLDYIFNPEGQWPIQEIPESAEEKRCVRIALQLTEEEHASIQQRELEAINLAEKKQISEALTILSDVINTHPNYPSAYNNRAQLYRLSNRSDDDSKAFSDLTTAIQLAESIKDSHVLRQAYTQRAIMFLHDKKEADAHSDFERASKLGSTIARGHTVQLNPYARMCNQMVQEVLSIYNKR